MFSEEDWSVWHGNHSQLQPGIQGYLALKKPPPPGTLQELCAQGHTVVLGGGRCLVSEVPLYTELQPETRTRWGKTSLFAPRATTGVPHLQENAPPWDPTVGLCLGS